MTKQRGNACLPSEKTVILLLFMSSKHSWYSQKFFAAFGISTVWVIISPFMVFFSQPWTSKSISIKVSFCILNHFVCTGLHFCGSTVVNRMFCLGDTTTGPEMNNTFSTVKKPKARNVLETPIPTNNGQDHKDQQIDLVTRNGHVDYGSSDIHSLDDQCQFFLKHLVKCQGQQVKYQRKDSYHEKYSWDISKLQDS